VYATNAATRESTPNENAEPGTLDTIMRPRTAASLHGETLEIFSGKQRIPLGEIRNKIYSSADDCIVIAGTIIEGIGNSLSDFDVYVIGNDKPSFAEIKASEHHWVYAGDDNSSVTTDSTGKVHQIFDYIGAENYAWDTEYWTAGEVGSLLQRVHEDYARLSKHGFRAGTLGSKTADFLHKILAGLKLQNAPKFEKLVSKLNVAELCYVLYRQYAGGYPYFRDISGAWHAGNLDLAVFGTREHVYDQVMSLTFLELLTNSKLKWLFDKVSMLPSGSRRVAETFVTFNNMPARNDGEKREFVLAGLDLIDLVFDRNRILLDSRPEFLGTAHGARLTHEDRSKRADNHEEFRRQIVYRLKMFEEGHLTCRQLLEQHTPSP
jgi:hypothetical protein